MAKLKTYSEFLNEGIMDVLKSPIKYVKIKNNAKKLVKAKVAVALNDTNFEKKKQKSKETGTGDNKVLAAANAAKNDALKDVAKGVSDRMDTLASSPILKKVSSLAKAKAALAANKTILKGADGEEAKQLKIKQTELTKKATKLASGIKDFESTAAKKKEAPAEEAPNEKDKLAAQKKEDAKKKADTTEETPDDGSAELEADIKAYNNVIEDERATMTKSMKELDAAKRDQKLGRVSDEQVQAIMKKIEDSKEDIAELKKKEAEAKKKLSTKSESLVEGMYTAGQLTDMLLDDIRKGTRKGIHTPDAKELKTLALKRLKMKRVAKVDIEDTINGWEASLADARKDKRREDMLGKIPESFEYVAESVSEKFARLRSNL